MPKCLVKGCLTRQIKGQRTREISLHSFPACPRKIRWWLESTGQHFENLDELIGKIIATKKTANYRICSSHFTPDSYEIVGCRKVLKANACPSIFPHPPLAELSQRIATMDTEPPMIFSDTDEPPEKFLNIVTVDDVQQDPEPAPSKKPSKSAGFRKNRKNAKSTKSQSSPSAETQSLPPVTVAPSFPGLKFILPRPTGISQEVQQTDVHSVTVMCQPLRLQDKTMKVKTRNSSTSTHDLMRCKNAHTSTGSYEEFMSEIGHYEKFFAKLTDLKKQTTSENTTVFPDSPRHPHNVDERSEDIGGVTQYSAILKQQKPIRSDGVGDPSHVGEMLIVQRTIKREDIDLLDQDGDITKEQRTTAKNEVLNDVGQDRKKVIQQRTIKSENIGDLSQDGDMPATQRTIKREYADDPSEDSEMVIEQRIVKSENHDDLSQDCKILSDEPETWDTSDQNQEALRKVPSCVPKGKTPSTGSSSEEFFEDEEGNLVKEQKFVIFDSCLDVLLKLLKCKHEGDCAAPIIKRKKKISGTCLTIVGACSNGHITKLWQSQPYTSSLPAGNPPDSLSIPNNI